MKKLLSLILIGALATSLIQSSDKKNSPKTKTIEKEKITKNFKALSKKKQREQNKQNKKKPIEGSHFADDLLNNLKTEDNHLTAAQEEDNQPFIIIEEAKDSNPTLENTGEIKEEITIRTSLPKEDSNALEKNDEVINNPYIFSDTCDILNIQEKKGKEKIILLNVLSDLLEKDPLNSTLSSQELARKTIDSFNTIVQKNEISLDEKESKEDNHEDIQPHDESLYNQDSRPLLPVNTIDSEIVQKIADTTSPVLEERLNNFSRNFAGATNEYVIEENEKDLNEQNNTPLSNELLGANALDSLKNNVLIQEESDSDSDAFFNDSEESNEGEESDESVEKCISPDFRSFYHNRNNNQDGALPEIVHPQEGNNRPVYQGVINDSDSASYEIVPAEEVNNHQLPQALNNHHDSSDEEWDNEEMILDMLNLNLFNQVWEKIKNDSFFNSLNEIDKERLALIVRDIIEKKRVDEIVQPEDIQNRAIHQFEQELLNNNKAKITVINTSWYAPYTRYFPAVGIITTLALATGTTYYYRSPIKERLSNLKKRIAQLIR